MESKCDQTKKFNIKFKYSVSNSKFQKYEGPTNSRSRVEKQGEGLAPYLLNLKLPEALTQSDS